jgi:hypothetical protein
MSAEMTPAQMRAALRKEAAAWVDYPLGLLAILYDEGLPSVPPSAPCTPIGYASDGTASPQSRDELFRTGRGAEVPLMQEYQQRVVDEEAQLFEKILRLSGFIEIPGTPFHKMPDGDRHLLRAQLAAMKAYLSFLRLRIDRFE